MLYVSVSFVSPGITGKLYFPSPSGQVFLAGRGRKEEVAPRGGGMLQMHGHRDSVLLLPEASITGDELNRVQQPGMHL